MIVEKERILFVCLSVYYYIGINAITLTYARLIQNSNWIDSFMVDLLSVIMSNIIHSAARNMINLMTLRDNIPLFVIE